MTEFLFVALGGSLVIATIGAVIGFWIWLANRTENAESANESFDERLQALERRLTDTQDVMLALSEKVDAWDAERRNAETAT